jgi:hypothetical protein
MGGRDARRHGATVLGGHARDMLTGLTAAFANRSWG